MDKLVSRVSSIAFIICVCFGCIFTAHAEKKETLPLEGKLGKKGMRSVGTTEKPVLIDTNGSMLRIEFNDKQGWVNVTIVSESNCPVYSESIYNPTLEYLSLDGAKSGYYEVEVTTSNGTYIDYLYVE